MKTLLILLYAVPTAISLLFVFYISIKRTTKEIEGQGIYSKQFLIIFYILCSIIPIFNWTFVYEIVIKKWDGRF